MVSGTGLAMFHPLSGTAGIMEFGGQLEFKSKLAQMILNKHLIPLNLIFPVIKYIQRLWNSYGALHM
jgi:hypothetical protein